MDVVNKSRSVLDRLKNQSKEMNLPFQTVIQLFAQEEFLRKLSMSAHNEEFILKGGMFIYTLTNYESRPTKDVDFIIRNLSCELDNIKLVIEEICTVNTGNDFIEIFLSKISQIGLNKEYPGTRISMQAFIGKARIPFLIDIGIDDIVIPPPLKCTIKPRLVGFTSPEIYTYSLESTIAEKLDAILQRMSATSRMKDFFDIYYLQSTFEFNGQLLCAAIKATTNHRFRKTPPDVFTEIRNFTNDKYLLKFWSNFEPSAKAHLSFDVVINGICNFLEPVYKAIVNNFDFSGVWNCKKQKWVD